MWLHEYCDNYRLVNIVKLNSVVLVVRLERQREPFIQHHEFLNIFADSAFCGIANIENSENAPVFKAIPKRIIEEIRLRWLLFDARELRRFRKERFSSR